MTALDKRARIILTTFALAVVTVFSGCSLPGRPKSEVLRPQLVVSFDALYQKNCAACHGANGYNGAAIDLANPIYQSLIDDATLREIIAHGRPGTLMPGFSTSSGGLLTATQVDALVHGMRERWRIGDSLAGLAPPPYKALTGGDPDKGRSVYLAACARCHGVQGTKPGPAGSILDGAFLSLVSDQSLRSVIISGRPDLGNPDWRGDIPGRPLTDAEVTDLTAWMSAQRPATPGKPYPSGSQTAAWTSERQSNTGNRNTH